jgi:hypothetical protein
VRSHAAIASSASAPVIVKLRDIESTSCFQVHIELACKLGRSTAEVLKEGATSF